MFFRPIAHPGITCPKDQGRVKTAWTMRALFILVAPFAAVTEAEFRTVDLQCRVNTHLSRSELRDDRRELEPYSAFTYGKTSLNR
jgi:hypothetical protein